MTYSFPWYYPAGGSLLALALSVYAWRRYVAGDSMVKMLYLGGIAFLAWFIIVPGLIIDELEITSSGARTSRAIPFTLHRELQFGSLESIERTHERNRWGMTQEYWTILYKDGRKEKFDLGELWRMYAKEITDQASKSGVRILSGDA